VANHSATILVVDDNESVRVSLQKTFRKAGYEALLAADGPMALALLKKRTVDVLVVDLKMPGMDGLELLKAVRKICRHAQVVIITGYGTIERAVEAMKLGAVDFIVKPFKRATLSAAVERALAQRAAPLRHSTRPAHSPSIVGESTAMRDLLDMAHRVAQSAATLLIEGESGTGKELLAEAVHRWSQRRDGPLIKVSCAALPEALLEAELFGHEKGAFTGAIIQRRGRFEVAHRGTLFLDEIGQFSPSMQGKLRVLQNGEFERLGGSETHKADVRVIAATNVSLHKALQAGQFREDLYYRLNVVRLYVPPLRERREDIPLLADRFLKRYARKNGREVPIITDRTMEFLRAFEWPGNVRELENVIERAIVLAQGPVVGPADLPNWITGQKRPPDHLDVPFGTSMKDIEKRIIEETLRFTEGDKTAAAGLLGVSKRTIYRKLMA